MDELKAMVTAIMDSLIEMTKRAVKAENLEEALRANIEKAREDAKYWQKDADYWRNRCEELKKKLEALKEAKDDTGGT